MSRLFFCQGAKIISMLCLNDSDDIFITRRTFETIGRWTSFPCWWWLFELQYRLFDSKVRFEGSHHWLVIFCFQPHQKASKYLYWDDLNRKSWCQYPYQTDKCRLPSLHVILNMPLPGLRICQLPDLPCYFDSFFINI